MDAFAAAGLQLAQHAQRGQALHAAPIHAQDAHPPALDGAAPHGPAHLIILACMPHNNGVKMLCRETQQKRSEDAMSGNLTRIER